MRLSRDGARSTTTRRRRRRSACRCSGSTGPNLDFRGFSGTIAGGTVAPGRPRPRRCRRGSERTVARIVTLDGDLDAGRRRPVGHADARPTRSTSAAATSSPPPTRPPRSPTSSRRTLVWMADEPMLPGRPLPAEDRRAAPSARRSPQPKYKVNVNTLEHLAAKTLELNEIGVVQPRRSTAPIAFDPYADNRDIGGFILIDRLTNDTVGAGLLHFALRRSHNIHWQAVDVDKARTRALEGPAAVRALVHRAVRRRQVDDRQPRREASCTRSAATPTCSTATTSATASTRISASPTPTASRTSAASPRSRKLMVDAGLIVLVVVHLAVPRRARAWRATCWATASSSRSSSTRRSRSPRRATSRACTRRRARGELTNFTGIDSPYEAPENARAAHRHQRAHARTGRRSGDRRARARRRPALT